MPRNPDVMLVGRAECFLVGRTDLDETIGRLKAYAAAGADCLYAPGIRTREQIARIVEAVAPKAVNVLIGGARALNGDGGDGGETHVEVRLVEYLVTDVV